MSRFIDPKVSLGTLLEIVLLLAAGWAWVVRVDANQERTRQEVAGTRADIETIRREYVRADVSAAHEQRLDEKLDDIKARLERIEARVRNRL